MELADPGLPGENLNTYDVALPVTLGLVDGAVMYVAN